jgi:hypothetical protein
MVQVAVGNALTNKLVLMKTKTSIKRKVMNTKYFSTLSLLISTLAFSQVAIGKSNISNTSVSLEFGTGNKGIILPWATISTGVSLPASGNKSGTFILDVNDKKVKLSKNDGTWFDLTVHNLEKPATGGNTAIDNSLQTNSSFPEKSTAKTMIGGDPSTDTTPGILVLADTNKAMIPPLVTDPATNIKNPAPGMMVYDPTKKLFAVYNGTIWSYWRQP